MKRRDFLMNSLALFALSALPKLTIAQTIAVSDEVKSKINKNNKLGFGFMRLPLKDPKDQTSIDYDELNKMVDTFLDRGFTYFDTAWMYMGYESEIAIRQALVKRHPRDKFTVASKMPAGYLTSQAQQEEIFNKQLEKTGLDYFDYYLVHNVNEETIGNVNKYDSFKFIADKKKEGKIKHIGFSFHGMPELLETVLKEHPEVEFVQLQINYVDWTTPVSSRGNVTKSRKNTTSPSSSWNRSKAARWPPFRPPLKKYSKTPNRICPRRHGLCAMPPVWTA